MRPWIAVVALAAGLTAQEVRVRGPEPAVVRLGDRAELFVEVSGVETAELGPLPVVDGLLITVGRREVAGAALAWPITLVPERAGRFALPPFTVLAGSAVLATLPAELEVVRDATGDALAFVVAEVARAEVYAGEAFAVTLRLGYDAEVFGSSLIPLFRARLDLPVDVRAPWFDRALPAPEPQGATVSFALNGAPVRALRAGTITRDGKTFAVLELHRQLRVEAPGRLELPAPLLRFAYATEFRANLFGDPVAADRKDAVVYGERAVVDVLPLPESGRPAAFTGAVGQFRIRAELDAAEVAFEQSFPLRVVVEGEGNFGAFAPPSLDQVVGLHVFGQLATPEPRGLRVVYDVAVTDPALRALPPLVWSYFDPGAAVYRTATTPPLPLVITGSPEPAPALEPELESEPEPPADAEPTVVPPLGLLPVQPLSAGHAGRGAPPAWWVALALLGPWLLAGATWRARRAYLARAADPAGVRARAAERRLRRALGRRGADPAAVLTQYLAARLRCLPAAVVAPQLEQRLCAAGVRAEPARRAAALLRAAVDTRYGGPAAACEPAVVRALVAELERDFAEAAA